MFRTLSLAGAVAASAALLATSTAPAAADEAYCDEQAHRYASAHSRGSRTVGNALVTGTLGAIVGRIVGGPKGTGVGALIGGTTGAIIGNEGDERAYAAFYQEAYEDCMDEVAYEPRRKRRGPVRLHQAATPEIWSDEWYEYCAAKYRSFNEETGQYLSTSGEYRLCR